MQHIRRPYLAINWIFILLLIFPVRMWFSIGPFSTITILDIYIWIICGLYVFKGNIGIGNKKIFLLLLLPFLLSSISLIWSEDILATIKMSLYCLTALGGYLVALNVYMHKNHESIERAMVIFCLLAVTVAILYWLKIPILGTNYFRNITAINGESEWAIAAEYSRLNNPFLGKSNDFGSILALFMFFFIGAALSKKSRSYYLYAFICLVGIVLTFSRGVLIALSVILLLSIINRFKVRDYIMAIVALGMLGIIVVGFTSKAKTIGLDIVNLRISGWRDLSDRAEIWEEAKVSISDNILLGLGGGRYLREDATVFHNTYLEQWGAYGIVLGTIAIIAILMIPLMFIYSRNGTKCIRQIAKFIGMGLLTFNIFCFVETSYEAAIPRLYLYIFIGLSTAYLKALNNDLAKNRV